MYKPIKRFKTIEVEHKYLMGLIVICRHFSTAKEIVYVNLFGINFVNLICVSSPQGYGDTFWSPPSQNFGPKYLYPEIVNNIGRMYMYDIDGTNM